MTDWWRRRRDIDPEFGAELDADPAFDSAMTKLTQGVNAPLQTGAGSGAGDVFGGVAAIQASDPSFNARQFLATVEAIFLRLRESWATGRPSETAFVDSAFAQGWDALLAAWRTGAEPVIFATAGVPQASLVAAVADPSYDTLVVRITAPATPGASFGEFRQRWRFVRYHIAVSADGQAVATVCPTCGAPVQPSDPTCAHCGAALHGATFEWRLNDITDVTHGEPAR